MATVILAILGAAIIGSITYGMLMMAQARENARATQILLEKIETIRLYNWSEVVSNGFVPTAFVDYYAPTSPTNQLGAVYNGTISVTNVNFANSYSTNMRQFVVTVNWTTGGRIPHTRSVCTYVAKDGIQNYVY